ncbi:MAG: hypothetical protein WC624_03665, partial [Candidatus Margulisiibacteriota bacterium]
LLLEHKAIEPASDKLGTRNTGGGRFLQALVFDFPITLYSGGVMHEIWGHGAIAREFGCYPSYNLLHWGESSDSDYACYARLNKEQHILGGTGGMEATQYLGHFTFKQMMLRGQGSYAEALMHVDLIGDTVNYLFNWGTPKTRLAPNPNEGNYDYPFKDGRGDIATYWTDMAYLRLERLKQSHSVKEISDKNLWNGPNFPFGVLQFGALWTSVLNPAFIHSAYHIGEYIADGKTSYAMPRVLPATNFVLTPEGPDFYFRLPTRFGDKNPVLFDPYVRRTGNYSDNAYGTGFDLMGRQNSWLTWRAGGDTWKQFRGWGGGIRAGADIRIPNTNVILGADWSCKTFGYAFGQQEKAGCNAYLRFGWLNN